MFNVFIIYIYHVWFFLIQLQMTKVRRDRWTKIDKSWWWFLRVSWNDFLFCFMILELFLSNLISKKTWFWEVWIGISLIIYFFEMIELDFQNLWMILLHISCVIEPECERNWFWKCRVISFLKCSLNAH